jgi:hypothetical protein
MHTEGLELLKRLFGSEYVDNKIDIIELIYHASEKYWEKNLEYIIKNGIKIKFLLVCEAPPLSECNDDEDVKYFYNPGNISVPQSYLEAVFNVFYPEEREVRARYTIQEKQSKLNRIAEKGFLLIDSLPFAMNYSEKMKRSTVTYKKLVKACAASYLCDKLKNPEIPWDNKGVKIAFSVWLNAREVIKNWPQDLAIKHCIVPETTTKPPFKQVAVNGSWNLCENALRRIFFGR